MFLPLSGVNVLTSAGIRCWESMLGIDVLTSAVDRCSDFCCGSMFLLLLGGRCSYFCSGSMFLLPLEACERGFSTNVLLSLGTKTTRNTIRATRAAGETFTWFESHPKRVKHTS